jgi:hypothetical protein
MRIELNKTNKIYLLNKQIKDDEKEKKLTENTMKQLEEQNKQISKAKEDFKHQVIIEKYEKENLEKQHTELFEKYKRLEQIESNSSTGYIKVVHELKEKLEKKIKNKNKIEQSLKAMDNEKTNNRTTAKRKNRNHRSKTRI